ncbi:MAG: hypothetical protein HXS46_13860 [Theionarchaea archaeon]|nr:hypothetical protein [Theionarchaea archaeon]
MRRFRKVWKGISVEVCAMPGIDPAMHIPVGYCGCGGCCCSAFGPGNAPICA